MMGPWLFTSTKSSALAQVNNPAALSSQRAVNTIFSLSFESLPFPILAGTQCSLAKRNLLLKIRGNTLKSKEVVDHMTLRTKYSENRITILCLSNCFSVEAKWGILNAGASFAYVPPMLQFCWPVAFACQVVSVKQGNYIHGLDLNGILCLNCLLLT